MKKVTFKIVDMDCAACAITIDGDLEDTGRVKSSKTNYAKSQTEVEFDPEKITQEEIVSTINKSGYKVESQ